MYFVVMPISDFIAIFSRVLGIICQLPIYNLFTQHAYLLWRDTTSELWTPVLFFTSIHPPQPTSVYFLQLLFFYFTPNISFHSIQLILCFQQTGEIDNLTVSWGKIFWLYCAGSTLLLTLVARRPTTSQPATPSKRLPSPTSR